MTLSTVDADRGVATITMDSAHNRNALGIELATELRDHVRECMEAPSIRVVVIAATGTVFSAGWDLAAEPSDGLVADAVMVELMEMIRTGPKPVVAKVNGHVVGGAIGLVACCDLSFASKVARFGFGEVRLGLAPTTAAVHCVPKIRLADALELFLVGERFSADRAVEVGLINRAVEPERLDHAVDEVAVALTSGGPIALAACKRLARGIDGVGPAAYALAAEYNDALVGSPEAMEGIAAFAERRSPSWARRASDRP